MIINKIDNIISNCLELQINRCLLNYLSDFSKIELDELKLRLDDLLLNNQMNSDEKLAFEKLICNLEVIKEDYNEN